MRERDELRRAYGMIAILREENDRLRRAVAAAYAALRPHAKSSGQGDGPVRESRRCSDSGMPIYDDELTGLGERQ
jgi:hypothetical protein